MSKQFKARAPAKLILSGEHAVVYGYPAIALAVNRYAESTIRSHFSPSVFFNFLNLQYTKSFTLRSLFSLKHELQNQYHAFLEGKCGIREVLKKPFELLQYTVSNLLEKGNISPSSGLEVRTSSNIPMGCGMGSSAATVMSTLFALAKFYNLDFDITRFLSLGKEAENLQHGNSSGLDLHLALQGGCLKFENGKTEKRSTPGFPLMIVETGKPESTTGQCVAEVASYFKKSSMGEEFAGVTRSLDTALLRNDLLGIKQSIRENHQLLVKIGVVPIKVQEFVRSVERQGGAAKICGAGSIKGEAAGVLLVVADRENNACTELSKFGYTLQEVQGDLCGTRLVS